MKLALFDVDGTLLDSQNLIYGSMRRTFERMDRPLLERSVMMSVVGLSLEQAMHRLLGEDAPFSEAERAANYYRDSFRELVSDPAYAPPLFPGVLEVIESLRRRPDVVLGIATGKSRRGVDRLLDEFHWHDLFITIQTADDAPSKPHPAMVRQAARDSGLDCADVIMIGDTSFDIEMGRAAGAGTIGVSWGNHSVRQLEEAGADHIIDDFTRLLPLVETFGMSETP